MAEANASTGAEPVANPAAKPEPRAPVRADAPAALRPDEPVRETTKAPVAPVAPAAKAEPAVAPPGPFAALPPSPGATTADAPTADAPALAARRANAPASPAPRPRRMTVHHAPLPRVAALPPFIPPSRPAAHQAQPITILRGGPFIHVPQHGTLSAAAALAPPPPGIRIMRGTRARPIAGTGLLEAAWTIARTVSSSARTADPARSELESNAFQDVWITTSGFCRLEGAPRRRSAYIWEAAR